MPNGPPKMTRQQKGDAVTMVRAGLTHSDVAAYYGVTRAYIWQLMNPPKRKGRGQSVVPKQYRAHNLVTKAIKMGLLIPKPCEVCGMTDPEDDDRIIDAHHDDYDKPLEVRWLCPKHHAEWHSEHRAKGQADALRKERVLSMVKEWKSIKVF